jgi:hypothetical protein
MMIRVVILLDKHLHGPVLRIEIQVELLGSQYIHNFLASFDRTFICHLDHQSLLGSVFDQ